MTRAVTNTRHHRLLGYRLDASKEVIDFLLRPLLAVTIMLLQLAFELLPLTVDLGQIVVRQLAPCLLDMPGKLFPVAFDAIPRLVAGDKVVDFLLRLLLAVTI